MNEKFRRYFYIAVSVAVAASIFMGGFIAGSRRAVPAARYAIDEIRADESAKLADLERIKSRLGVIEGMAWDAYRSSERNAERLRGGLESAVSQAGDVRATVHLLREAVADMEADRDSLRSIVALLDRDPLLEPGQVD